MSAADDIADFYVHTASVQTLNAHTGRGTQGFASAVDVACFVTRKRRLTRDQNGREVVSESQLTAPPDKATLLAVGSLVTLPGETTPRTVMELIVADSAALDLPDHVMAVLQ